MRAHIHSLGDKHRQGEGLRGSNSSASRLLRRYTKGIPPTSPGLQPSDEKRSVYLKMYMAEFEVVYNAREVYLEWT